MARAWSMPAAPGERSVAAADEDSLTMAVEAGRRALATAGAAAGEIDMVVFASTTRLTARSLPPRLSPRALDVDRNARTVDLATALRGGLSALAVAADAVRAGDSTGGARSSPPTAHAERPKSMPEQLAGDAPRRWSSPPTASSATLDAWVSRHDDLTARWRLASDQVVREFEPRLEGAAGVPRSCPRPARPRSPGGSTPPTSRSRRGPRRRRARRNRGRGPRRDRTRHRRAVAAGAHGRRPAPRRRCSPARRARPQRAGARILVAACADGADAPSSPAGPRRRAR